MVGQTEQTLSCAKEETGKTEQIHDAVGKQRWTLRLKGNLVSLHALPQTHWSQASTTLGLGLNPVSMKALCVTQAWLF